MGTSVGVKQDYEIFVRAEKGFNLSKILRFWPRSYKVHRYHADDNNVDFMLSASSESAQEYVMTSCRPGVRTNDIIRIHNTSGHTTYQVLDIDYYADPPDMWTAQLVQRLA